MLTIGWEEELITGIGMRCLITIGWEEELIIGTGIRCLLLGLGGGSYYWVGGSAHY